jgi:putative aldouronate transport system substrate-binding protein
MKRTKFSLRTGLVLVLLVVSASLCFAKAGQETGATAVPSGKAGAALSWQKDTSPFQFDLYFYGAWGTFYPWKGSYVEKVIEQKTGVHPNIIVATGDEKEYLSVLVASGKLPDAMVLEYYGDMTKRIIQAGKIYPIKELTDKYAPEFWDQIPQDVKTYHSETDGKLYYLPSFMSSKEEFQKSPEKQIFRPFFIQKGIYEALGKPSVDTPEKFIAMLKMIKQRYPDKKVITIEPPVDANQWGLTGCFTLSYLLGAFAPETYGNNYYLEGNAIKFCFESKGMVNSIKFLNTLVREGLMSVDRVIARQETFGDEVSAGIFAVTTRYPIDIYKQHNPKIMQVTGNEKDTYIPLEYLHVGGKDPQYAGGRGTGWVGSMVTKDAKNPGRIIRYFEYSWSDEGQMDNLFGKEGETYTIVNGIPRYTAAIIDELNKTGDAFWDKYGFERRLLMWRSLPAVYQKLAIAPQGYTDYLLTTGKYAKDTYELGIGSPDAGGAAIEPNPSSKEGVQFQKIKDVWSKAIAQMIIASDDAAFEGLYTKAMDEIRAIGLEDVRKVVWANHLDDVNKKLGKK